MSRRIAPPRLRMMSRQRVRRPDALTVAIASRDIAAERVRPITVSRNRFASAASSGFATDRIGTHTPGRRSLLGQVPRAAYGTGD